MAIQMSTSVRNARLDAIETATGASARLRLYSGAAPADCAAAATGTLLVEFALAADWAGNAAGGGKSLANLPLSTTAAAAGVAGHFRLYNAAGSVCHYQGSVTIAGGGGDMTLDNTNIASGQTVSVTSFTITEGNA